MSSLSYRGACARVICDRPSTRRAVRRNLVAAGATVAMLTGGAPALADTASSHVVKVLTAVIEIESDGKVYTKPAIALTPVAASVNIALDAGVSGRIKSYKVWLKFRTETSDWVKFPQHAASQSFPLHQRPKALNSDVYVSVPYGSHSSYLVSYCNFQANDLRHSGMTDQEIFSQDRPIEVGVHSDLEVDMSGVNATGNAMGLGGAWDSLRRMIVNCKAKNPERIPVIDDGPTRKELQVESASLMIIERGSHQGACSLEFAGTIKTKQPDTEVKFRFESEDGKLSEVKTVTTSSVRTYHYAFEYPLSPGGMKTGKIRVKGVGENFASDWKDYEVNCGSPAQDVISVLPPKAVGVEAHATGDDVLHRGLVCPAKVKVYGVLKGRGTVSGAVALFAAGQLKKLQQYSIEDGQTIVVEGEHALTWGPTQAQQSVTFAMNVTNASAAIVDQLEHTEKFSCHQVQTTGVAQGAVGGVSTGKPVPTQAQQAAGGRQELAQGPAFAVMAPKGPVRDGQIRLSGGAADATYDLTFYRKSDSGLQLVKSAQLPAQMAGRSASFPLSALTGGRAWRLEVCPAGPAQGSCKTSDFRLLAIGAAKAGAKAPEQPQGGVGVKFPGDLK